MIYNNSTDPVLIQKISLNIWLLRDEIESLIKNHIEELESQPQLLEQLKNEYQGKADYLITEKILELTSSSAPLLSATPESSQTPSDATPTPSPQTAAEDGAPAQDYGEDEMMKAMAEAGQTNDKVKQIEEAKAKAEEEKQVEEKKENGPAKVYSILQRLRQVPLEKISRAKTILGEINMQEISFFCDKKFIPGQSVIIEFCIPRHFVINADITFCKKFNMRTRIISNNNYIYRVGARFTFVRPGERTLLRNFTNSIATKATERVAHNTPPKEAQKSEDINNDLDNLLG